jgi:hypothetical protein
MCDGEHSVDLVSQSLKDLLAQSLRRQRRYARLYRVLFLVVLDARAIIADLQHHTATR